MASFIYGCNNTIRFNYGAQTPNPELPINDLTRNETGTVQNNSFAIYEAIRNRDTNLLKQIFLNLDEPIPPDIDLPNEYRTILSMLKAQDSEGKTPLHIMGENGGSSKLLVWILKYLMAISFKDIKDDLHDILTLKDKKLFTAVDYAAINDSKSFIKVLLDKKYISKHNAEDAINFAIRFAKSPANSAVKLLCDYTNDQGALISPDQNEHTSPHNTIEISNISHVKHVFENKNIIPFNIDEGMSISENKYRNKSLILQEKDQEGNTLLHTLAENCDKRSINVETLKGILEHLEMLSHGMENINFQEDIEKILSITNGRDLTPINIAAKNGCKDYLEVLSKGGYIPIDMAKRAINWVDDPLNNDAVKLLNDYIKNNDPGETTKEVSTALSLSSIPQTETLNQYNQLDGSTGDNYNITITIIIIIIISKKAITCPIQENSIPLHTFEKSENIHSAKEYVGNIDKRASQNEAHKVLKHYKCFCGKKFNYESQLRQHERTHTGEKRYQCTYCDYRFGRSDYLKRHIRTHTGEKRYQCTYCDCLFGRSDYLKRHIRTHTGEKQYQCTYCDYCSNQSGHLERHIRTHTGEKRYQCTYCDYRCNRSDHLRRHIRTHTGEKPYQCTYCDYGCNQSSYLKQHIRTHAGEKRCQCTVCRKKFKSKRGLIGHLKNIHKQKNQQSKVPDNQSKDSRNAVKRSIEEGHLNASKKHKSNIG